MEGREHGDNHHVRYNENCSSHLPQQQQTAKPVSSIHRVDTARRSLPAIRVRPGVAVTPTTAREMLDRHERRRPHDNFPRLLPTPRQVPWLALVPGMIHELAGASGSGKTQMALSLCMDLALQQQQLQARDSPLWMSPKQAQYKSPPPAIIYVSLQGGGPSILQLAKRLEQMAIERVPQHYDPTTITDLLQRIWTKAVANHEDLGRVLHVELPNLLSPSTASTHRNGPALLVVDSLAGIFRGTNDLSIAQRSALLFQWASQLQRLSRHYHLSILMINQISHSITATSHINTQSTQATLCEQPALGLSWAYCVHRSYRITKLSKEESSRSPRQTSTTRLLRLERSSEYTPVRLVDDNDDVLSPSQVRFHIERRGTVAVPETDDS